LPLLDEFNTTITVCMNRLSSVSSPLPSHVRGLVELQRASLYSLALLDYTEIFQPNMTKQDGSKIPKPTHRIGAFVWNDEDALSLSSAGLPVYLIRLLSDFDRQNI
ncbi:hypothetical protein K435DRAFT_620416, partial [Dendrothele bispora CBS 962.96]